MTNTVRHIGYGILLNLSLDDLGHPDRPGLWEEIYRPRPFTEVLRCPEPVGAGFCPEVMYVQVREGQRVAVHRNKDVANHARSAESDLHQALKDRVAESAVAAGLSVEVESSSSDRARVTDVLVGGHTGRKIGWEIQISGIAPRKVLERSSVASRDRITPLWTVTRMNAAPTNRAPWARLPVMDDWRMARARHLAVQGGVRKLVMRPCELPWFTKCPAGARALCGKKHPTLTPLEVELDDLILWSAEATYLPLFRRTSKTAGHYMWVSASDKAEYLQGQPEELPYADLSIATVADGPSIQAPKPDDPACHYGEQTQAGQPRPPRETGDDLPAPILARPRAQRSLDWSGNQIGAPRACRICGEPAIMTDTHNEPCHKVCAEAES